MTQQMQNLLIYIAAAHLEAIKCINAGELDKAKRTLLVSHPFTATGDALDAIAVQVGVPARNGVKVPDEILTKAILKELSVK